MPNNNKGGYKPNTKTRLPDRFRCKVGGEWKPRDEFSNNQMRFIQRQIDNGQEVNAARSGMTCREHASKPCAEFRCERCGLIKPADDFSKNARRNEVFECKRCVAWAETQEPDVTPAPLETGHISWEEEHHEVWQGECLNSEGFFDTTSDEPLTAMAGLSITAPEHGSVRSISYSERSVASSCKGAPSVSGASTNTIAPPPHLAPRIQGVDSRNVTFAAALKNQSSSPGSVSSTALPPHLRSAAASAQVKKQATTSDASDNLSQMSGYSGSSFAASQATRDRSLQWGQGRSGSSYQSGLGSSASISTATTVREGKAQEAKLRQIPYNAWDPKGKKHAIIKEPTVASSGASSASTNDRHVDSDPMNQSKWLTTPVPEPECRGNGKWPKASESRIPQNELKKQPRVPHISTRHVNPDIDRQRRMNYCDSDDSDY